MYRTCICVGQHDCNRGRGACATSGTYSSECGSCIDGNEGQYVSPPFSFSRISFADTCGFLGSNQSTDRNTIVFTVKLECSRNKEAPKDSTDPKELYINHELLSSHLVWKPAGEQQEVFAANPPAPTNPNIVLAKLRPGQAVEMELHAIKGVGKDHAKFSPVGMSIFLLCNRKSLTNLY